MNKTYLLPEIVVDERGLRGQAVGRVDGALLVHRRILRGLVHRQQIKPSVVPLVEEDLGAQLLDDHVPGVVRAGAAHDGGQDLVGGKDVAHGPGEAPDHRIVGGGHRVYNAVHLEQWALVAQVYPVEHLVIVLQGAAGNDVLALLDVRQRQLEEAREVQLLDGHPIGAHKNRALPKPGGRIPTEPAALVAARVATLSVLGAIAGAATRRRSAAHARRSVATPRATSVAARIVAHVGAIATALVGLLGSGARVVHQVEGGVVVLVEVRVLAAVAEGRGVLVVELLVLRRHRPITDLAQAVALAERLVGHLHFRHLARTPAMLIVLHYRLDKRCVVRHGPR